MQVDTCSWILCPLPGLQFLASIWATHIHDVGIQYFWRSMAGLATLPPWILEFFPDLRNSQGSGTQSLLNQVSSTLGGILWWILGASWWSFLPLHFSALVSNRHTYLRDILGEIGRQAESWYWLCNGFCKLRRLTNMWGAEIEIALVSGSMQVELQIRASGWESLHGGMTDRSDLEDSTWWSWLQDGQRGMSNSAKRKCTSSEDCGQSKLRRYIVPQGVHKEPVISSTNATYLSSTMRPSFRKVLRESGTHTAECCRLVRSIALSRLLLQITSTLNGCVS